MPVQNINMLYTVQYRKLMPVQNINMLYTTQYRKLMHLKDNLTRELCHLSITLLKSCPSVVKFENINQPHVDHVRKLIYLRSAMALYCQTSWVCIVSYPKVGVLETQNK